MKWKYIVDEEVKGLLIKMEPLFSEHQHKEYCDSAIKEAFGSRTNLYNLLVVGLYIFVHISEFKNDVARFSRFPGVIDFTIPPRMSFGREITVEYYPKKPGRRVKVFIKRSINSYSYLKNFVFKNWRE